jgi:hypothetical protein
MRIPTFRSIEQRKPNTRSCIRHSSSIYGIPSNRTSAIGFGRMTGKSYYDTECRSSRRAQAGLKKRRCQLRELSLPYQRKSVGRHLSAGVPGYDRSVRELLDGADADPNGRPGAGSSGGWSSSQSIDGWDGRCKPKIARIDTVTIPHLTCEGGAMGAFSPLSAGCAFESGRDDP